MFRLLRRYLGAADSGVNDFSTIGIAGVSYTAPGLGFMTMGELREGASDWVRTTCHAVAASS